MGGAAKRNANASSGSRAPGESGVANTSESLTVVVVRAFAWDEVASVGQRTPISSGVESSATSAAVIGRATARNSNTSV